MERRRSLVVEREISVDTIFDNQND
jgi:hypothetical protein